MEEIISGRTHIKCGIVFELHSNKEDDYKALLQGRI